MPRKRRRRIPASRAISRSPALSRLQPTFQDTAIAPAPIQAGRAKTPPTPSENTRREQAEQPDAAETGTRSRFRSPRKLQHPAPVATVPAPAPAPVASIGAGTAIDVTSGSQICTTALPGEKFVATLNGPITGANGASLPSGSTAVIEVASTSGTDANATINFRVKAIVVGDKTYPVTADVQPEATLVRTKVANPDGNADKKKVIGGAIAGAILGQMIGHNTKGTVIGAAGRCSDRCGSREGGREVRRLSARRFPVQVDAQLRVGDVVTNGMR